MCAASHHSASASLTRNWEMQIHFKWRPKFAIYSQFCNPSPVAGWRLVATRGVARRAVNTNSLQLGHEETFSFTPPAFLLHSSQSALFRCKKFWPLQPLLANLPPDLQCLENCRAHNCRAGAPLQSLPWAGAPLQSLPWAAGAPLQSLPWGAGLKSVRLIILRKPPTATSEARLLPWYPSEAFLCFPLPPHCHNPDTLPCMMTPHPAPSLNPSLAWTDTRLPSGHHTPVFQCPVSSPCQRAVLSVVFKWLNEKERWSIANLSKWS